MVNVSLLVPVPMWLIDRSIDRLTGLDWAGLGWTKLTTDFSHTDIVNGDFKAFTGGCKDPLHALFQARVGT